MAAGVRAVWRAGTRGGTTRGAARGGRRPSGHHWPALALQAAALVLVAAAQGLAPTAAPTAAPTGPPPPHGLASSPPPAPPAATTPAPPTIRHRLHVSAPPIALDNATGAAAATPPRALAATPWPSPTAAPRARGPQRAVAPAPAAPAAATLRPPTVPPPAPPRMTASSASTAPPPALMAAARGAPVPTLQTLTTPSQAERPNAADATSSTKVGPVGPKAPDGRPPDDEQYPMYAEYPDTSVNLTNSNANESGEAEGDVVPDPDAALRQEDEERERASLAEAGAEAAPPDNMQFLGEAVRLGAGPGRRDMLPAEHVLLGSVEDLRIAGDVSGAAPGDLDLAAGFERAPVAPDEELGIPVEPQDQDLRERDRLDGDGGYRERAELQLHSQGAAGKQVVIVGAALALVAQFLCLASAMRRLRPGRADVSTAVLFNVELALIVENLVFMLGVQSVGEPLRCRWVALALHYLHLVAAGWFLANTAFLSYRLRARLLPAYFKPVAITVWALPAVLVAAMYAAEPRSYETRRYCWMAVQRGMLLTFVLPVTVLMTFNTALALCGLRAARGDKGLPAEGGGGGGHQGQDVRDPATPSELRSSVRAAAIMLPLYSADWFLGVVAMDNSTTLAYPLLFLVTNGFLNWFLMVCAWLIVPRECKETGDWCGAAEGDDLDDEEEYLMEEDDAGCWGKASSASASLLSHGHGHHQDAYAPAYGAEVMVWGGEDAAQNVMNMSMDGGGRWDEAGSPALMREVELASPTAGPPAGLGPGLCQELAEMRYDGAISTIYT